MKSTIISKESKAISIDLNNLVHSILYEDIERYVIKNADTHNLTQFEIDSYIEAETSLLTQYLKNNGYNILYYYDELGERQQEINDLSKHNRMLRHNVSSLQKKINGRDKNDK